MRANLANFAAMTVAVRYRGASYFIWLFGIAVFFLVLAVVGAVHGQVLGALVVAAIAAACLFLLRNECRRVDLRRDDTLEVRYYLRPRLGASVKDVQRIEKDSENHQRFTVSVGDRKFTLSSKSSAQWLVKELVRRNPDVELSGYTIPPQ
jgi:hypothetical protein